jgi:hypothetical protein
MKLHKRLRAGGTLEEQTLSAVRFREKTRPTAPRFQEETESERKHDAARKNHSTRENKKNTTDSGASGGQSLARSAKRNPGRRRLGFVRRPDRKENTARRGIRRATLVTRATAARFGMKTHNEWRRRATREKRNEKWRRRRCLRTLVRGDVPATGRAPTLSGKSIPEHLPGRTDPPAEKQNKPALGRIRYQKSARKMKFSDPKRKDQPRNKLRFFNRNPT